MNSLRVFFIDSWLSFRGAFQILSPVMFFTTVVLAPFFELLFFLQLGRFSGARDVGFYVVGNAIYSCCTGAILALASSIAYERRHNTLILIDASPVDRMVLFGGRTVPALCLGLCSGFVALAGGFTLTGTWPGVRVIAEIGSAMIVGCLSAVTFGLALGAIGLCVRDMNFVGNSTITALLLLSGAVVPVTELPWALRAVSSFAPLSLSIRAAGNAYCLRGGTGSLLLREFAVSGMYFGVAAVLFRWFESMARKRARLELS